MKRENLAPVPLNSKRKYEKTSLLSLIEKMSNLRQKIVLFIEPTDKFKDYGSASTIGNFYMNRFAIGEDASHEIVKIYEVSMYHKVWCKSCILNPDESEAKKNENGTDQIMVSIFRFRANDPYKPKSEKVRLRGFFLFRCLIFLISQWKREKLRGRRRTPQFYFFRFLFVGTISPETDNTD